MGRMNRLKSRRRRKPKENLNPIGSVGGGISGPKEKGLGGKIKRGVKQRKKCWDRLQHRGRGKARSFQEGGGGKAKGT